MTSKGRFKAVEWKEFEESADEKGNKKQKCRHCEENVSSKVERLRQHLKRCNQYAKKTLSHEKSLEEEEEEEDLHKEDNLPGTSTSTPSSPDPPGPPLKRSASDYAGSCARSLVPKIDKFVQKTTEAEKKLLDRQFARMFYACNIPFSVAENEHMLKLIHMLRGGSYKPPNRRDIAGYLLDEVNKECESTMASELEGQNVTLIQDGWSNVHNQPIIGTCLHNGTSAFFIRSVDTGSEKKTAEYCCSLAEKEIDYCEETYGCKASYSIIFCTTDYSIVHLHCMYCRGQKFLSTPNRN